MRDARKAKGYTQSALASMVGVTQQQVAKYELGLSGPSRRVIDRLAVALELSPFEVWDMFNDHNEGDPGDDEEG